MERLKNILKFAEAKENLIKQNEIEQKERIDMVYMEIENPLKLEIDENCIALSLYGNKISDLNLIKEVKLIYYLPFFFKIIFLFKFSLYFLEKFI